MALRETAQMVSIKAHEYFLRGGAEVVRSVRHSSTKIERHLCNVALSGGASPNYRDEHIFRYMVRPI